MSKIMELADVYATADCEEHVAMERGTPKEFDAAIHKKNEARTALQAEVEKLEEDSKKYIIHGMELVQERDALREKLALVERDAARYRFVRQADGFLLDRIADMSTDGSEFDASIDAAMQEATK